MEVTTSATVLCQDCNNAAEYALCQKHLDQQLKDSFDQGHKEGYQEGLEEGIKQSLPQE